MTQSQPAYREPETRPNTETVKARAWGALKRESRRIVRSAIQAGTIDLALDAVQATVAGVTGFMAYPAAAGFEVFEMAIEKAFTSKEGEGHNDNMLLAFTSVRSMYEDLLERTVDTKRRDVITSRISKIRVLQAWYTRDMRYLQRFEKTPEWVAKRTEKVVGFVQDKIIGSIAWAIKEVADILPVVSQGTIDEVSRAAVLAYVAGMFNKHPDVAKNQEIHFSMRLVIDALKQTLRDIRDTGKGIKASDFMKRKSKKEKK